MFVKLFEEFISESESSKHYMQRVKERIESLGMHSTGDFKGSKNLALSRCKKLLMKKAGILEKKSYFNDFKFHVENFGEILLKDTKANYIPTLSTDDSKIKGNKFIAIVFNNLLITVMLVNGDKSQQQIVEQVEKHCRGKYKDFDTMSKGVAHDYFDGERTIIDMDLSEEEFDAKINPKAVTANLPATKVIKEMTIGKGTEITFIGMEGTTEVYRRKTVASLDRIKNTLFVTFTDNKSKTFVCGDGLKINKKFVVTPAKGNTGESYVGDITEFGMRQGKHFIKIAVSQTIKDIKITPST